MIRDVNTDLVGNPIFSFLDVNTDLVGNPIFCCWTPVWNQFSILLAFKKFQTKLNLAIYGYFGSHIWLFDDNFCKHPTLNKMCELVLSDIW